MKYKSFVLGDVGKRVSPASAETMHRHGVNALNAR